MFISRNDLETKPPPIWNSRGGLKSWRKEGFPPPSQSSQPSSLFSFPLSLVMYQPSISILRSLNVSCVSSSLDSKFTLFQHLPCRSCYIHDTISSVQFSCSVMSDSCDPMNCRMPGLPVHHQLLESTQTHVHCFGDAIQPSHPLSSPSPPALNLSQNQGLFKRVSSSHHMAKVLEFQLQHQALQ